MSHTLSSRGMKGLHTSKCMIQTNEQTNKQTTTTTTTTTVTVGEFIMIMIIIIHTVLRNNYIVTAFGRCWLYLVSIYGCYSNVILIHLYTYVTSTLET